MVFTRSKSVHWLQRYCLLNSGVFLYPSPFTTYDCKKPICNTKVNMYRSFVSAADLCMPKPDVTSLPIVGSADFKAGSGETGARSTRRRLSPANSVQSEPTRQVVTSCSASNRKSTKIDLTPDVINWYSTSSNIPRIDTVRRSSRSNDYDVELAQSSSYCRTTADNWLSSLRLHPRRRYPPDTSVTLERHKATSSSNTRGGTHHVTWYQSPTIGRQHSETAVDHLITWIT